MSTYCFDFDGTLANTIPIIVNIMDRLIKEKTGKGIDEETLFEIKSRGIRKGRKKIDLSFLRLFFLVYRARKEMAKEMHGVKLKEGMKEALEELKGRGCKIGIITSNSKSNVLHFLKENDLPEFDFVISAGMFGKKRKIRKISKGKKNFVYIGDEIRDVEAGKSAGVFTIAASWGLSYKESLASANPDMMAHDPEDILSFRFS